MRRFNNMSEEDYRALSVRFAQGDLDRWMKMGSREIEKDIALMERNLMRCKPPWYRAVTALKKAREIERQKYGAVAA